MWAAVSTSVFFVAWFVVGDLFGLMQDGQCVAFFGCYNGFFGYDAFVHLSSGAMFVFFIIWLGEKHPRFRVISGNFWKSAVIIVALCVSIGTVWEMIEFGLDHARVGFLHQRFFGTDEMQQSSNSDTMGDETFNLIGGIVAVTLLASFKPRALTESEKLAGDSNKEEGPS
jgi:uncharacterized membrane protein YjdF